MAKKTGPDHEEIHLPKGFESIEGDGTGSKLAGWIRRNFSSVILPIIALIVLGGGIYLYSQQRQPTSIPDQLAGTVDETSLNGSADEPTGSADTSEGSENPSTITQTPSEAPGERQIAQGGPTFDIQEQPTGFNLTATAGEGITHLARRALRHYVDTHTVSAKITNEHAIYIEDYLQNRTGSYELQLGEQISFSFDLLEEGINMSQNLSSSQLNNLEQYSQLVPSLDYPG